MASTNINCHTKLLLLLALGIEVNWDFLKSAKQKDVGSTLALDQNFFCMIFRLCETFFRKFFKISPKGSPSFFLFCNRMDVQKSQRVPLLHFSALCNLPETSKKNWNFFPHLGTVEEST